MNRLLRHPTLASAAALLALLSIPVPSQAGPSPGNYSAPLKRTCREFSPPVIRFPRAKGLVTNTIDPGASFGNKVVMTGRKGRARVKLEMSFIEPDTVNVSLTGRDFVKSSGSPGGKRLRNFRMRGTGPAIVTSNSFGTNAGIGRAGRHRARFKVEASSVGNTLRVYFDARTSATSPFGSRMRLTY